jgi:hypothetical protein
MGRTYKIDKKKKSFSESHSPRVGPTIKDDRFALGFNGRTAQLRTVADFFVKRELMGKCSRQPRTDLMHERMIRSLESRQGEHWLQQLCDTIPL